MPETKTMRSRERPSSGMKPWITFRIAQSPQPGHQRTSWSDLKSFEVSCVRPPPLALSLMSPPAP